MEWKSGNCIIHSICWSRLCDTISSHWTCCLSNVQTSFLLWKFFYYSSAWWTVIMLDYHWRVCGSCEGCCVGSQMFFFHIRNHLSGQGGQSAVASLSVLLFYICLLLTINSIHGCFTVQRGCGGQVKFEYEPPTPLLLLFICRYTMNNKHHSFSVVWYFGKGPCWAIWLFSFSLAH